MADIRLGFALCGSFCTLTDALKEMEHLKELKYDITPIMSEITYSQDTRFGTAESFVKRTESICGKKILKTISECEPIGPKKLLDILLIAPCTGNTLGKLANGITDTSVTMAAKAHLRNERPVVLALATNDSLSGAARNIGALMARKNVFFVPFGQDDPANKPTSCIANFDKIPETLTAAMDGRQVQPLLFS
jgi:dipicolinate synthase subunit B